jgi:hypothetical protein
MLENINNNEKEIASKKRNFLKKIELKQWLIIWVIFIAIGGVTLSAYYFNKYRTLKTNPNLEAQEETNNLVDSLSKLMELPTDETPTVATVVDKEKLKDQPFFANAQDGDKLLVYTKTMQAILYRPSTNKIINVAPIVVEQQEGVEVEQQKEDNETESQTSSKIRIAYYNGTETTGLADEAEKTVTTSYPDFQTTTIENASKKDYNEILVIDLTEKYSKEAQQIATLLNGKVSSLPDEEVQPNADILVISGK